MRNANVKRRARLLQVADLTHCTSCGYAIRLHVTTAGEFIGCPSMLGATLGNTDALPRITVRVGKAGARKGKVLVCWPDCQDRATGKVLVWDIGSGEQYLDDQYQVARNTRRAGRDQEHDVKDEVEYQIKGAVRVIAGNWARGTGE